ncbi:MAG: AIPR family protein [Acetobacteraceae bacterium]
MNKGIRETIRDEPDRFLAYNNGLAATADEIEVGTFAGETVITRVRGLQIVNGGQTLASIHRARKVDKMDIGKVAVAMKLTRVEPTRLAEFVPLIAKYANTQNVIQVADLSANSEFHISMEQLSERTWCPGEEARWFYERARGGYQAALTRLGVHPGEAQGVRTRVSEGTAFRQNRPCQSI